jgi:hypothetical protein
MVLNFVLSSFAVVQLSVVNVTAVLVKGTDEAVPLPVYVPLLVPSKQVVTVIGCAGLLFLHEINAVETISRINASLATDFISLDVFMVLIVLWLFERYKNYFIIIF